MAEPRWYIVHVYSGFEKKVREEILKQAEQKGMAGLFEDVLVPSREVVEIRRGKKVSAESKLFPGYVLVRMALNDETWSLVRNTPKVTGFLGQGGKPMPVPDVEAERIRAQMQEASEHPKPSVTFVPGETVRVTDGAFASFSGVVEEVDEVKSRLKVSVSIFGRATPVELEFSNVEKQ